MNVSHECRTAKSVEWYTPAWVFQRLDIEFDLDPSSPHDMTLDWIPATKRYTVFDDGLSKPWYGRVWLNPPYSKWTQQWMRRMTAHANGIALVFSRTDAAWFQEAIASADAVLFVAGRIEFVPGHENKHKKSRSGAASVFMAWGSESVTALRRLSDRGFLVYPNSPVEAND
ncbi:MAG: adenine methyltransferase [Herbaspirillum huttiense]|uniref:DNA N-6-adenine-methyltransferase n=1 Tax=Herbaspirillum huttiense TaxID=863372 RepID=UPI001ACD32EB|nr:DNA N-6-adenine-methyltransferase [Herbaspirillum huttiense]MBN9356206.1 adenine methyltransferase [Herbaspirillum huttiense]